MLRLSFNELHVTSRSKKSTTAPYGVVNLVKKQKPLKIELVTLPASSFPETVAGRAAVSDTKTRYMISQSLYAAALRYHPN